MVLRRRPGQPRCAPGVGAERSTSVQAGTRSPRGLERRKEGWAAEGQGQESSPHPLHVCESTRAPAQGHLGEGLIH